MGDKKNLQLISNYLLYPHPSLFFFFWQKEICIHLLNDRLTPYIIDHEDLTIFRDISLVCTSGSYSPWNVWMRFLESDSKMRFLKSAFKACCIPYLSAKASIRVLFWVGALHLLAPAIWTSPIVLRTTKPRPTVPSEKTPASAFSLSHPEGGLLQEFVPVVAGWLFLRVFVWSPMSRTKFIDP